MAIMGNSGPETYGMTPEQIQRYQQLMANRHAGRPDGQGIVGVDPNAQPAGGAPPDRPGQPVTYPATPPPAAQPAPAPAAQPVAQPAPAAPDPLAELRAQLMGYDPTAGINEAHRLASQQALGNMGMEWEDNLAARGIDPGAATGQDLKSRLTAQVMGPLAAAHAQQLAAAQGDRLSRLQSLTGMQLDQQRLSQQQAWQQAQDAEARRRWDAEQAYRNSQTDYQHQQDARQNQWQTTQQQWQTDDRNRQLQAQAPVGGVQSTPTAGGPVQQTLAQNLGVSGGGVPYVGSGGMSDSAYQALIGGGGGAGTSITGSPAAPSWGGGTSSGGATASYGQPTPGWNSGAGRTGGTTGSTLYQPQGGSYRPPSTTAPASGLGSAWSGLKK